MKNNLLTMMSLNRSQKQIIEDVVQELLLEDIAQEIFNEKDKENEKEDSISMRSFRTKISIVQNNKDNNNNIKDHQHQQIRYMAFPFDMFYGEDVIKASSSIATSKSTLLEHQSSNKNHDQMKMLPKTNSYNSYDKSSVISSYSSYSEYCHHRDYYYEQEEDDSGYFYQKSTSTSASASLPRTTTIIKITKTKRKTLLSPKLLLCKSQRPSTTMWEKHPEQYDNEQEEYRQPSLGNRNGGEQRLLYQQQLQRDGQQQQQRQQPPRNHNNIIQPYPLEKTKHLHLNNNDIMIQPYPLVEKTKQQQKMKSFVNKFTGIINNTSSSLLSTLDKLMVPLFQSNDNKTTDNMNSAHFNDNNKAEEDNINSNEDIRVTVLVEAAALCVRPSDCQNDDDDDNSHGTMMFSGHFVGTVVVPPQCESSHPNDGTITNNIQYGHGIRPKQRVASMVPWYHANHPCVSVRPKYLIKVPKHFDAADIACLVAFYLPAFQVLHHGQRNVNRFNSLCFHKKKILFIFTTTGNNTVTNPSDDSSGNSIVCDGRSDGKNGIGSGSGIIELIKAMIRVATHGGCTDIYVIAPKAEHKRLRRVMNHPIIIVDSNQPNKWLSAFDQSMDIVIDCSFPNYFDKVKHTIKPKVGRLVCYPSWGKGFNCQEKKADKSNRNSYIKEWYQLSTMKRSYIYDLKQSTEVNYDDVVADMQFLLRLLEKRIIRPLVKRNHHQYYCQQEKQKQKPHLLKQI